MASQLRVARVDGTPGGVGLTGLAATWLFMAGMGRQGLGVVAQYSAVEYLAAHYPATEYPVVSGRRPV